MNTPPEITISLSDLKALPAYANYLLNNRLEECIKAQIKFGYELNPPLLKQLLNTSDEVIYQITKDSLQELFSCISNNKTQEYIDISRQRWIENQLPVLEKNEIVADDITLLILIRKKVFMSFIMDYTHDATQIVLLVNEIDLFNTVSETSATNTLIDILKEGIEEHSQKLQKSESMFRQAESITHIGNYIWDLQTNILQWSDELYKIYELEPGTFLAKEAIAEFNHPDDNVIVEQSTTASVREMKPFDFYYRIILSGGREKTLHARGEIKKDSSGKAEAIIGTLQDETEKQKLIATLTRSESVYQQAEELANMGTWTWDIKSGKLDWTDHLYKIYGIAPQSEEITIDRFLSYVHPEEKEYVKNGIEILQKEEKVDYTFRIITKDGKTKWLRSIAQLHKNEKGVPDFVIGTERDVTEKQLLISRLKESEQLYKQAQTLAHIGNWTMEIPGNTYTWSDEMYNIYETQKGEEVTIDKWADYIHPEDKEEVLKYFQDCLEKNKMYDKVHRIILASGKVKTVHRKGEFVFDTETGIPLKMVGTTQDVTEQFLIQQELKDNQKFIRKITDATPSIIASYNIKTGKYVFISGGLQKILGYDPEEAMERGVEFFANIIHPDDVAQMMEKNARVLEEANADVNKNDLVAEFTYRMRNKDGDYRWFHTYGTIFDRNSEGEVEYVLNISLDITEQVEASEKIKEQEHFIQQIAEASPTILYLYDVDTQNVVYINREIFFVLGHSPEEIINKGSSVTEALYHPDDYSLLPERNGSNKKFKTVDSMMQYECRLKHKDGEWRWLLIREIVFKVDEEGKVKQILGAALDINRRKDMEKTILQNSLQLEQSNASLEEFAYVASHDLKEPLRKISTFGDRLVASQANSLTPEGKVYLQKIVDASQRMQTMISDLLSISMITGNRSFENFNLQKVLEEALLTLEYKIEQQNAIIRYDILPDARIVPSQFRQLFQNLLSNSLKFVKEGRQPIVSITFSMADKNEVRRFPINDGIEYHKISFSDNGIGFENEFAGKIFAIFQRLHGRSEYEGSGIGLAICKKIVEHHQGFIYATGEPDKGATFSVLLPV